MTPELSRRRLGAWVSAFVLLIVALGVFGWCGSGADPQAAALWTWTKSGWLAPAPGLGLLWVASVLLFALLSTIAAFLFNPVAGAKTLKPWASAAVILALAIGIRIFVAREWTALPLEEGVLKSLPRGAAAWWWLAVGGDVAVMLLLLLALAGARRSLWWSALYALHPLTLLEIAGNGHWIAVALVPLVFVAALSHRFGRRVRVAIAAVVAGACVAAIMAAGRQSGFNSLSLELAWVARLPVAVALPVAAILAQGVVLGIAWRRDWDLARMLVHVLVMSLIFSPVVEPWYVIPVVALIPLAWSRAGWVLSLTVLGAYMVVPIARAHGHAGGGWRVPDWWLLIEWVPVMALEVQELWAGLRDRRTASAAPAATLDPAP